MDIDMKRKPTEHELKTDSDVFGAVVRGDKLYEIRKDDRDFKVGDVLHLKETVHTGEEMIQGAPLKYTGREAWVEVGHILRGPVYGLTLGWCIMSFAYGRVVALH